MRLMLIFRETGDFIHFSNDINTFTSSGSDVLPSANRLSSRTVCELEIFLPKDAGYWLNLLVNLCGQQSVKILKNTKYHMF